jgi:preprotein translocase subunit SecE
MAKAIAVAEQPNVGIQQLKDSPKRLLDFLKDVRAEMKKVVTPSKDEVKTQTIVVIATVFLFAAYFWVVDNVVGTAVAYVIQHLGAH